MNTNSTKNNKGFTLVEVMVSLAVLVIASLAALQAIYISNVISIEAKEKTIAVSDARAVLERIKITSLSNLPTSTTVNASAVWSNVGDFVSNSLLSEQITVSAGSGSNVRQISVTVQWIGPRKKQMQVQFTTLKSLFNG